MYASTFIHFARITAQAVIELPRMRGGWRVRAHPSEVRIRIDMPWVARAAMNTPLVGGTILPGNEVSESLAGLSLSADSLRTERPMAEIESMLPLFRARGRE